MEMAQNIKIVIITAVKNDKQNLEKTILNIKKLKKINSNIVYIVIDGSSDDGSVGIIKKHQSIIDHWISEPDKGLYDAYNKGWGLASKNSFVLYLGAGDQLIQLPDKEILSCKNKIIYGRVNTGRKKLFVSRISKMSKIANTLHHQALLVPKYIHINAPFNTKYKVYADFDFNQRLIKQGVAFYYSKEFLAYAMPGGVSENYSKESFKISYKNFGLTYGLLAFLFYLYQKSKPYSKYYFNKIRFDDFNA